MPQSIKISTKIDFRESQVNLFHFHSHLQSPPPHCDWPGLVALLHPWKKAACFAGASWMDDKHAKHANSGPIPYSHTTHTHTHIVH